MVVIRLVFQILSITAFVSAFVTTRELGFLVARQALEPTDIPSECTAACAPLFTDVETCGSKNVACLCTATVSEAGVACADCIAGVLPSTLQALQSEADTSVLECQQGGDPIAPVTIVGETVSDSNPPAAGSAPAASNSPTTSGSDNPSSDSPSIGSPSSGNPSSGNPSSGNPSGSTITPPKSNAQTLLGYLQPFFAAFLSAGSIFFLGFY